MAPTQNVDTSIVVENDRLSSLTLPDYGLHNDGIGYLSVESVIQGKGPNRIKFLDFDGQWNLNGKSVPYISCAFNHLERLNEAQKPIRDFIDDQPLNAIGKIQWTPSEAPKQEVIAEAPRRPAPYTSYARPAVEQKYETAVDHLPHRSAGYGAAAHEMRQLYVPQQRSRSPSPQRESPIPEYPKYQYQYQPKDSLTVYGGQKWSARDDMGYVSSEDKYGSGAPSPRSKITDHGYGNDMLVSVKEETVEPAYRTAGYDLSPRSMAGTEYSSSSEQQAKRNPDDVYVTTYHSTKTTRREQNPRRVNISSY